MYAKKINPYKFNVLSWDVLAAPQQM